MVSTGIFDDYRKRSPYLGAVLQFFVGLVAMDVQKGARAQLWAATAKGVRSGALYKPSFREYTEKILRDERQARELEEWTEREFEKLGY